MKRTNKRPDGTEEVLEGTPEELAEYERRLREPAKKPKPDVLKGSEAESETAREWRQLLKDLADISRLSQPVYVPYLIPPPILVDPQPCWICGAYNCRQMHIWCGSVTVTSDSTLQLIKNPQVTCGTWYQEGTTVFAGTTLGQPLEIKLNGEGSGPH